jgi:tRNA/tmRNA/rRNA uracil-C5-methylase (TrmA/RlmC/RlmD family)
MIVCKTADVDAELLAQVKQQLIEYLTKSVIGLASLCFLDYNGEADSVPTDKPQLLWGTSYYQERIFDHVFRVSPTAFLQIHLDMCEVLYSHIINAVKECDVVLDLGCGIGTIGISIRKKMPEIKVIGI